MNFFHLLVALAQIAVFAHSSYSFADATASSLPAQEVAPTFQPSTDFPFAILGKNQVGLCSGTQINVRAVNTIGATRSGGCCGSNEEWNQATMVPYARFGQVRRFDMRASIEQNIRGFSFGPENYDRSLVKVIDPLIALTEQISFRNSVINACISRIDLANINQTHAGGTVIDFDISINIYVTLDTASGRQTLFVQQLGGHTQTHAAFYNLFYDYGPRAPRLISDAWPVLQGKFDQFLAPLANGEANQNLNLVKSELSEYLN